MVKVANTNTHGHSKIRNELAEAKLRLKYHDRNSNKHKTTKPLVQGIGGRKRVVFHSRRRRNKGKLARHHSLCHHE